MSLFRIGSNLNSSNEIDRIKKEISDCDKDISAFSSDKTKNEADKTNLQADADSTQSAMTTAETNVATAQNAISSAQSAVSSAQSSISSAQSAVSSASSIPGEEIKDEEGNVIGMDYSARDAAVAEAQAQLAEAQAQLSSAEGELANAQAQYSQAQAEQEKTKADYQNMLDEIEAMENELNNLEADISTAENEKSSLEAELQAKEAEEAQKQKEANEIEDPTMPPPIPQDTIIDVPTISPATPKWSSYGNNITTPIEEENGKVVEAKSAEEAMKNTAVGDVFELPNEDKIFIKTEDNKFEQLDISKETYYKLFETPASSYSSNQDESQKKLFEKLKESKYAGLGTNMEDTAQLGLGLKPMGLEGLSFGSNIEYVGSELFKNPETKYLFLSCFSEDADGNISITVPNSDCTFTLNKEDDINNYYQQNSLKEPNLGLKMFEVATSSFIKQENINYEIENINKKLENMSPCSDEMANTIKDIVSYAKENNISDIEHIIDAYFYSTNIGESTDSLEKFSDKKIIEMLNSLPTEDIKKSDINYIYNLAIKEELILELQEEQEKTPSTKNTPYVDDAIQILAQFGLDENYQEINKEAYELAEEFTKKHSENEYFDFNSKIIAAYINNNKNNQQILEKLIAQENLSYEEKDITTFFEEANKEDSDINFILEYIDLNWNPTVMLSNNKITPENIDLAKAYQEIYGKNGTLGEFDYILQTNKILPEDDIIEYMKTTNLNVITEATKKVFSIIPSFEDDGTTRSELLKADAQKVYEAMLNGKNIEDLIVPTFDSEKQGLKKSEIGDVYEVEGEDYIYIKTGDKEFEQLNITKETYNKLFPAVQRYMSEQGKIGDCYLVSMLNNIMTNSEQREVLLRCFSENENGDITVDLPNGNYSFTLPNGAKVTDFEDPKLLSDSSTGMQMLEFCYGLTLKDEELAISLDKLTDCQAELLADDYEKYTTEDTNKFDELSHFILTNTEFENKENAAGIISNFDFFDSPEEKIKYLEMTLPNVDSEIIEQISAFLETDETSNDYLSLIMLESLYNERINAIQNDPYGTMLRNEGGSLKEVYKCFGIETRTSSIRSNFNIRGTIRPDGTFGEIGTSSLDKLLENPNIQIVAGGTIGSSDKTMLDFRLNIAENHAYTIYPKQQENGEWLFEVINPWDESRTSILTIEDMENYFDHIEYIETKPEPEKESFWDKLF